MNSAKWQYEDLDHVFNVLPLYHMYHPEEMVGYQVWSEFPETEQAVHVLTIYFPDWYNEADKMASVQSAQERYS